VYHHLSTLKVCFSNSDFQNIVEDKFASDVTPRDSTAIVAMEKNREFSRVTRNGLFTNAPAFLGVVNVLGVNFIRNVVKGGILERSNPLFHEFLKISFPALFVYSAVYVTLPIARGIFLKKENQNIEGRNKIRQDWCQY